MLEMDDDTLIAMALREHAQTCEEIAAKYDAGAGNRKAWLDRATRCRLLAVGHERAAKVERAARGQAARGQA